MADRSPQPDFKTIAEFRRAAMVPAFATYAGASLIICRDLKLFTQAVVAIDGSKFKAVNSRDNNFTPNKIARRQEQIRAKHSALFGCPGDG